MLTRFDSDVGGLTMTRDVAVQLLKAMGHSGTVPGAILPEDIPAALAKLKGSVEGSPKSGTARAKDPGDDDEVPVSLRQRAFPLIDLLSRAAERGAEILWK